MLWGFFFADLLREEMVYVYSFSLHQLSSVCPLHTTTTSIPRVPLRARGQMEPQESSRRQPPSESGGYKGIHLFFSHMQCDSYFSFFSILDIGVGGLYLTLTGQCSFLCWVCVCSECLWLKTSILVTANLNFVAREKLQGR